jgi:hypothetical protein
VECISVNLGGTMLTEKIIRRINMLAERTKEWEPNCKNIPVETREEFAMMFASTFSEFEDFADLGMRYLGFTLSPMQRDIARYMQYGPRKSMVQAQRGEAKSTLAALYAVWTLIHDQSARVLIVSAGEDQASDVATLVIRVIEQWHILCWLRPDSGRGDRTSYEHYDVHCDLKPVDKSASVSCIGITANLPGRRADLLIPDDIESPKNSMTQTMRDQLLHFSKEFSAICTHGRTLYLGTPQTKESIYKTLPARGFEVRVWTGRYPNREELENYPAGTLAPFIYEALERDPTLGTGGGLDGTRGQPADPVRFNEEALLEKELDWGPEGFALQYMLNTSLSDAMRTKVKLSDLIVGAWSASAAPELIQYSAEPRLLYKHEHPALSGEKLYMAASASNEYIPYQYKVMRVDPAGDGGDEVAFAAGGVANGYVHIFTVGGLRGGICKENIQHILDLCIELDIQVLRIEKNMGHGTVEMLFVAEVERYKNEGKIQKLIGVEGEYNTGQKERRIIDTVSPLSRRHRLVVHQRALEDDAQYCALHAMDKRTVSSGFYQLGNITYDRGSLSMDDRADCISDLVRDLSKMIAVDDREGERKRKEALTKEFVANPMGRELDTRAPKGVRASVRKWRR